jgi:hypothetical protein
MAADREPHTRARSRDPLHHALRILRRRNRKKKIRFRARNIVHVEFLHARLRDFCGAHWRFREIVIKLHGDAVLRGPGRGRICSLLRLALLRATLLRARRLRRGTRVAPRRRLLPAPVLATASSTKIPRPGDSKARARTAAYPRQSVNDASPRDGQFDAIVRRALLPHVTTTDTLAESVARKMIAQRSRRGSPSRP